MRAFGEDCSSIDGVWPKICFCQCFGKSRDKTRFTKFGHWPTFPQLWVNGELVGGCDIVTEMHSNGELKPLIDEAIIKNMET